MLLRWCVVLSSLSAQATALMRYLHPAWRTPGAMTEGANGEKFGADQFAHVSERGEHEVTCATELIASSSCSFDVSPLLSLAFVCSLV
jgi:hypothetical protein